MKHYPMPVVVVSSLTPKDGEAAIRALSLGAVEVIQKPGSAYSTPDIAKHLVRAIRTAAITRPAKRQQAQGTAETIPPIPLAHLQTTHKVIAIGASTGGTQAIESVLSNLPATTPGTVIVQHMPQYFTAAFAERLNQTCQMEVREARDNDLVVPGVALVAPGNHHMVLQRSGSQYLVRIKDGPSVHYQRPSVDVLFHSVARSAGKNAIGVLLTGMGADGAKGMLAMKDSGAYTLAQDEQSCIVFGMPKEAIKLAAVDEIVPLSNIAQAIIISLSKHSPDAS